MSRVPLELWAAAFEALREDVSLTDAEAADCCSALAAACDQAVRDKVIPGRVVLHDADGHFMRSVIVDRHSAAVALASKSTHWSTRQKRLMVWGAVGVMALLSMHLCYRRLVR